MQGCLTYTELTSYFEPDIKNNPFYDLPAGWYVISGDVTVTSRIRLNGDVKFILTDGAQLDAKWGIDLGAGDTFTVYGQTDDAETMGKLTACIPGCHRSVRNSIKRKKRKPNGSLSSAIIPPASV